MRDFLIALIALSLLGSACTPEQEKITFDTAARLRFSTDTIFFDTLFTQTGSITQRLKVYNDFENAVNISKVALGKGSTSPYTVYVNGKPDHEFAGITLLGKDSLLLLTEVTIDPQDVDLPFVVEDEVIFETNSNEQKVHLVAWGQDAHILRDSVLSCDAVWSAGRPYVIYNGVLVDSLCTLTVEAGTKVYAHNGAHIFIQGSIQAEGSADDRILFRNDRLDVNFENAPGQWGGIVILEGATDNRLLFTDIRNAVNGVRIGAPDKNAEFDLIIGHSKIENMSSTGILAFTSDVYAYNTLVNNCAINAVGNFAGGNYKYEHCTFANYSYDFFREDPTAVFADNVVLADNSLLVDDLSLVLNNNIIWGSLQDEVLFSNGGEAEFVLSMQHNILRTNDESLAVNGNILNIDPKFIDPRETIYKLDTLSQAKDAGIDLGITTDLEGNVRDDSPDIGAYERIEN